MKESLKIVHSDCDAVGSIVLNKYFNIPFTEFMYSNYPDYENKEFVEYIKTFKDVYFADISPDKDLLIELLNSDIEHITIFDHHEARNYLVDFKHEKLTTYFDITRCGTKIYFEEYVIPYCSKNSIRIPKLIYEFVELVDVYDLWKLDNPLREKSENLNRLFLQMCNYADNSNRKNNAFITNTIYKIQNNIEGFTEDDMCYINAKIEKEKSICIQAKKLIKLRVDERGVKYAITKASSCISYVAKEILNEYDIDYVIVLNTYAKSNNGLSIRSKDHFDINELNYVAGHKNSGGYSFPNRQLFNSFYDFGKQLGYKKGVENV